MTYKTEFPDFDLGGIIIPFGFYDNSWHNDVCPHWENEQLGVALYIDYIKPEDRECQNMRFMLAAINSDGEWLTDDYLIASDSWKDITDFLRD